MFQSFLMHPHEPRAKWVDPPSPGKKLRMAGLPRWPLSRTTVPSAGETKGCRSGWNMFGETIYRSDVGSCWSRMVILSVFYTWPFWCCPYPSIRLVNPRWLEIPSNDPSIWRTPHCNLVAKAISMYDDLCPASMAWWIHSKPQDSQVRGCLKHQYETTNF